MQDVFVPSSLCMELNALKIYLNNRIFSCLYTHTRSMIQFIVRIFPKHFMISIHSHNSDFFPKNFLDFWFDTHTRLIIRFIVRICDFSKEFCDFGS